MRTGNSPGILNTGDFDLQVGSTLNIEIGGTTAGTEHDQVHVTGTVTLAGTLDAGVINGFTPSATQSFTIIDNDGNDPVVGTFDGFAEGSIYTIDSVDYILSYRGLDGGDNDVVLLALPTIVTWDGGGDGTSWDDPLNWDTDVVPGPTDKAIMDIPADVTVVHSTGVTTVFSIVSAEVLTVSGGTLDVTSTVQVSNAFNLAGGILKNARVVPGLGNEGLTVTSADGTLDGVTLAADTELEEGAQVTVLKDLILDGATVTLERSTGSASARSIRA